MDSRIAKEVGGDPDGLSSNHGDRPWILMGGWVVAVVNGVNSLQDCQGSGW